MNHDQIRALIHRLSEEHKSDHDGGYALVAALKHARDGLSAEGQPGFVEVLAEFVRVQEPELWAVALETLLQLGHTREVAELASELTQSIRDDGRKDYVVLGLLRLGLAQVEGPILEHIRASLERPRPLTVPMITALNKIDRDICLDVAAAFFEGACVSERARAIEGAVPAFVRNFAVSGEQLLADLVRRVMLRKPEAGRWLARSIIAYLGKPWIIDDLGGELCASIKARVAAAEHTLN